jgi:hypothetical protein
MSLLLLFSGGAATQPSGGWVPRLPRRGPGHWPREETESEREARILAERIRLGIIEAEAAPPPPTEAHSEPILGSPTTAEAAELRRLARLSARADAFAEAGKAMDLAGLRTAASLDAEIELYLENIEARRLHRLREEEWILLFE